MCMFVCTRTVPSSSPSSSFFFAVVVVTVPVFYFICLVCFCFRICDKDIARALALFNFAAVYCNLFYLLMMLCAVVIIFVLLFFVIFLSFHSNFVGISFLTLALLKLQTETHCTQVIVGCVAFCL